MVLLIQIVMYGLISGQALVQIQLYQAIIDWNAQRFLSIVAINTGIWLLVSILEILCEKSAARATLVMNNQVRQDMAATLLCKNHQEYHAQESGEYLSWLTTGVERIENSAWNSFFCITAYVTRVVTSLVALATLHWSLLLASVATGIILLTVPQLFQKRMERLGEACAQEQAVATGKLKELLGGFDVLCFFGRKDRFLHGIEQVSDQIENPKYRQAYIQRAVSAGLTLFVSLTESRLKAQTLVDHQEILDAVCDRDGDGAAKAMARHIEYNRAMLEELIGELKRKDAEDGQRVRLRGITGSEPL